MRITVLTILLLTVFCAVQAQSVLPDTIRIDPVTGLADTVASDTTGLLSDSTFVNQVKLTPLFSFPLQDKSHIITNSYIKFNNFRHTEDILNSFSFSFLNDKGSIGNPSELYLYGSPVNEYLIDGRPAAGLWVNGDVFDLNNIMPDQADSIEVITLPRSVIYNGVPTVNFITKDFAPVRPYTRIKYYQGANGEALFDGIFSSQLYRKLYGYLEVANRKLDRTFANTAFSSWQAAAKLKYIFSKDVNLSLGYNYSKLYKGLNGGVNADSLTRNGVLDKENFYSEILAPVNYYRQDMDQKLHNFDLNLFARASDNFFTNASVYYHYYRNDFNNIIDSAAKAYNFSKLSGVNLRQYYTNSFFNINVNLDYKTSDNTSYFLTGPSYNQNVVAASGVVDFNLSGIIKPSAFVRYSKYSGMLTDNNSAFGFDLLFRQSEILSIYGGYALNYVKNEKLPLYEASVLINLKNLHIKGGYFSGTRQDQLIIPYGSLYTAPNTYPVNLILGTRMTISGASLSANYRLGSFEFDILSTLYQKDLLYLPEQTISAGAYFHDSLFYPNLLLKAGLKFNYIGKRTYFHIPSLAADYTIDFTLVGEIRKTAVIYFTFENLLDRKYYIVPYYPMYQRNLRFGVAWELFN